MSTRQYLLYSTARYIRWLEAELSRTGNPELLTQLKSTRSKLHVLLHRRNPRPYRVE
jgi:hypothetical protein